MFYFIVLLFVAGWIVKRVQPTDLSSSSTCLTRPGFTLWLSYNLKIDPIFFPSRIAAAPRVAAINAMVHTPKAQAVTGPDPRIRESSSRAFVMG